MHEREEGLVNLAQLHNMDGTPCGGVGFTNYGTKVGVK